MQAGGARKHAGRADARCVQAREGRKHAGAQARGPAGRPVRPFSSHSGAPGSSRVSAVVAARREASEAQGVPRAPKDSRQALEPQPGRIES